MKRNIKAIFFDIDGTLQTMGEVPMIPASTRLALTKLRDKGVKLFIATGRPPVILKDFKSLVNFEFDGWVTTNGQYCTCGHQVIRECIIPEAELERALCYLQEKNIGCVIAELDYAYKNMDHPVLREYMHEPAYDHLDDLNRIHQHKVYQLMVYIDEKEEEVEKGFFDILKSCKSARWIHFFMDVIPKDGGKNKGIDAMLEHFEISLAETMAFGDGGNDIDMLRHVGIGIAMGNAKERVKEAADYVTDDIDNDGIYKALVHYGILEE